MANTDRRRQQSSEAPQSGTSVRQQGAAGSGQGENWESRQVGTRQPYGRGGTNVPAQRGLYEPAWYGTRGTGPFALMRHISDEMDRIFESFGMGAPLSRQLGSGLFESPALQSLWAPNVEIRERDGKLQIQVDLPGVNKDDVSVQIEPDAVILKGERKQETTVDERGYYHSERSYGSFHRVIPLPEGVDTEQAKATFKDGVLQIDLPVPQQRQRGRTLTIEDLSSTETRSGTGQAGSGGRQQG
jgi:HSP20 family protein